MERDLYTRTHEVVDGSVFKIFYSLFYSLFSFEDSSVSYFSRESPRVVVAVIPESRFRVVLYSSHFSFYFIF